MYVFLFVLKTVLPTQGPKISHDKSDYTAGDGIVVNCTSDKSNLESFLNFTINDQPVSLCHAIPTMTRHNNRLWKQVSNGYEYETVYTTQLSADGLKTSILTLRFQLGQHHFRNGKMRLRCIASVAYYKIQNEAKLTIKDIKYKPQPMHIFSSESQGQLLLIFLHFIKTFHTETKIKSLVVWCWERIFHFHFS